MLKNGSSNADMTTTTTDASGKFCFKASPGNYKIEVELSFYFFRKLLLRRFPDSVLFDEIYALPFCKHSI